MMNRTILTVTICLLLSAVAQADIFHAPTWDGDPVSVHAEWNFDFPPYNLDLDMAAEIYDEVGGWGYSLYPSYWPPTVHWGTEDFSYQDGKIYNISGGLTGADIWIANWVDIEPLKKVRIQITCGGSTDPITTGASPGGVVGWDGGKYVQGQKGEARWYDKDKGQWCEDWTITPNPQFEVIFLSFPKGAYLDQIVIDTISLPEPATLLLLGLGGIFLRIRK